MVNISISLDEDLVQWLDRLIAQGIINSRSEAVRNSLFAYIKQQLQLRDRKALREFIRSQTQSRFPSGAQIVKEIRGEE